MNKTVVKTMVPLLTLLVCGINSSAAAENQAMGMDHMMSGGKQCRGNMLEMLDENKDGKVSKEEFTKHHDEMFSRMDKNTDGSLDASELKHPKGGKHKHKHKHKHK